MRRLGRWLAALALALVLISVLWVAAYRAFNPPITFTQVGDLLNGRGVRSDWMPLHRIDDDMKRAVIAAEDSKFCRHHGFDQDAIAEAMRRNAQGGGVMRGGSTISQQTAKNAFLWQGGGYFRKAIEAWFTLLIETMWSKQRIMEVYLNIAETGIGTYGVNAGAQRYFGKDASRLTRTEAARIAAVLPLPKKRDAADPGGFTRRYGNSIAARIRVVARDGLDSCLHGGLNGAQDEPAEPARETRRKGAAPPPAPPPERIEDYIDAPAPPPDEAAPAVPAEQPPQQPSQQEPAPEPEPEPRPEAEEPVENQLLRRAS